MAVTLAVPALSRTHFWHFSPFGIEYYSESVLKNYFQNVKKTFPLDSRFVLLYNSENSYRKTSAELCLLYFLRIRLKILSRGLMKKVSKIITAADRHDLQLVSLKDAASLLQLHERTLRKLVRHGDISCVRRGSNGRIKFTIVELGNWVQRNSTPVLEVRQHG